MKVWVNANTYNEKDNIRPFVERVMALGLPEIHLCIVDDNSPDGTGQIADELASRHPALTVVHKEKKEGVGPAYRAGFAKGFEAGADYFVQIDADLSHDPSVLPLMIAASQEADMVIGSRYVRGGRVENIPFIRDLISKLGNTYISLMLHLPVKDVTSGLILYSRALLEAVNLSSMSSRGYSWQIEMKTKALRLGFKLKEIPITFYERKYNQSKFKPEIAWECLTQVRQLRHDKKL